VAATIVLALLLVLPSGAPAATVLAPRDGDTVPAEPMFTYDFLQGTAEVELSRSPDLLTSGPAVGSFVDIAASEFAVLYLHEPLDGVLRFTQPVNAGRYFWHTRMRDDGAVPGSGTDTPWTQVATLDVADEPAVLEGWTLQTQRLHTIAGCRRLRLRGKIAWHDNDPHPDVRLVMAVRRNGSTITKARQQLDYFGRYDVTVCARGPGLSIAPRLEDRIGQVTVGAGRRIS
jgi:hypothetical protein